MGVFVTGSMSRFFQYIAGLFFIVGLAGCSGSPGDSAVERAIKNNMDAPFMSVSEIERVDGYKDGEGRYIVEASYRVTFDKGMDELMVTSDPSERFVLGFLKMTVGDFEAGDSYLAQNEFTFVKAENGWRIVD